MQKVRTIFQPDRDQEMPDDEAEMFRRNGHLIEEKPAAPAVTSAPVAPAAPKEAAPDGDK